MSGDGILEIDNCLIRADRILYVEEIGNDVEVDVEGLDDTLTLRDCTLSRFRQEWKRALES